MCAISGTDEAICLQCKSLLDLRSIFDSSGRDLKRFKAIYHKPAGSSYANVKEQYNYLIRTVYDGKGNYLYHQNCVRHNTINHHHKTTIKHTFIAYKTYILHAFASKFFSEVVLMLKILIILKNYF